MGGNALAQRPPQLLSDGLIQARERPGTHEENFGWQRSVRQRGRGANGESTLSAVRSDDFSVGRNTAYSNQRNHYRLAPALRRTGNSRVQMDFTVFKK